MNEEEKLTPLESIVFSVLLGFGLYALVFMAFLG